MVLRSATLAVRVCGVFLSIVAAADARAASGTGAAAAAAGGTLFEPELDAEAARLAATRGKPEGIVPLLAVASLYEEVPPGLVERILRETADAKGTDPLVAAQAATLAARIDDDQLDDPGGAPGQQGSSPGDR